VEHLNITRQPELHAPVAVIAFAGWNDAASAATNAARFLVRRMGARKFASVDPEAFYVFSDTRPSVRVDIRGQRQVDWPANDLYYARNPTGPHDIVVIIGVEPNLRWQTFAHLYQALFTDLGVTMAVSLGALMADVPHTIPVRVTGTAADPETAAKLRLATSRYEGPTGIVGVLHDLLRRSALPAASLWANVPHYLTTNQNPPATLALLERLQGMIGLSFDFAELVSASERFVREVNAAVEANSEIGEYVRKLEAAAERTATAPQEPSPLPEGPDLVLDIEEFLRTQRDDR